MDYDAVGSCLRWVKERHGGKRIGLPKIGAGSAGGDWQVISPIIDDVVPQGAAALSSPFEAYPTGESQRDLAYSFSAHNVCFFEIRS